MSNSPNRSKSDAMYLRILANLFELHREAISKATNNQFHFSPEALRNIADKVQENGYKDDIPADDVRRALEERVYGA